MVNEVGHDVTEPITAQPDVNYVEIRNLTGSLINIGGFNIKSCTANGSTIARTTIPSFDSVPANGFYVAGDDNYAASSYPARELALGGPNGGGIDPGGGVATINDTGDTIHGVRFDTNSFLESCLLEGNATSSVLELSPSPTDPTKSAQRCVDASGNVTWVLAEPTPGAANC